MLHETIEKIKSILNKSEKNGNKKDHNKNQLRNDWMTAVLLKSCRVKDKLYKTWQIDKTNKIKRINYTTYANKLKNLITYTKRNY